MTARASSELLYYTETGSGPPLLLVHGLMVSGEMFEPVIGHFAARHRVIVPDLRGHGRSRGLPPPYAVVAACHLAEGSIANARMDFVLPLTAGSDDQAARLQKLSVFVEPREEVSDTSADVARTIPGFSAKLSVAVLTA